MMMKIAAILFLLLLTSALAAAQEPPTYPQESAVFAYLQASTAALKAKTAKSNADALKLLDDIEENVKTLAGVATGTRPVVFPAEYLESLTLDADLLKKLAGQKHNPKSAADRKRIVAQLKDVDEDVAIKVVALKHGRGGSARLVEVTAHARKEAQDLGGYEVWYVPKGWASNSGAYKRFDGLSNPSSPPSMNLAPGNYLMWLSKGGAASNRQPVSIGGDGRTKRDLDLVAP
jgi:hypothetical protein